MSTRPPISLQLYTVRDALAADPLGTLERVASLGYQGIEGNGFGNSDAFLAKVQELGLRFTGGHVGIDTLQNQFDAVVEHNKAIGNTFLIIPYLGEEWRGSLENWTRTAKLLDDLGARLREEGITLSYHNHAFELEETVEGKRALDWLYNATNPQNLQAELDTYWVQKGGGNPVEYLRTYANRTPLLHIKDMDANGDFAEIGAGVLDWPAIFAAAEAGGVTTYVVEQDTCPGDPFDSLSLSIENLRGMGKI